MACKISVEKTDYFVIKYSAISLNTLPAIAPPLTGISFLWMATIMEYLGFLKGK